MTNISVDTRARDWRYALRFHKMNWSLNDSASTIHAMIGKLKNDIVFRPNGSTVIFTMGESLCDGNRCVNLIRS
jgi:hypothetical protein